MKRKAYIKPNGITCNRCLNMQVEKDIVLKCTECVHLKQADVLQIGSSFWGTYALVENDKGEVEKISVDRISFKGKL